MKLFYHCLTKNVPCVNVCTDFLQYHPGNRNRSQRTSTLKTKTNTETYPESNSPKHMMAWTAGWLFLMAIFYGIENDVRNIPQARLNLLELSCWALVLPCLWKRASHTTLLWQCLPIAVGNIVLALVAHSTMLNEPLGYAVMATVFGLCSAIGFFATRDRTRARATRPRAEVLPELPANQQFMQRITSTVIKVVGVIIIFIAVYAWRH